MLVLVFDLMLLMPRITWPIKIPLKTGFALTNYTLQFSCNFIKVSAFCGFLASYVCKPRLRLNYIHQCV